MRTYKQEEPPLHWMMGTVMHNTRKENKKNTRKQYLIIFLMALALMTLGFFSDLKAQVVPPNIPEGVEFHDNEGHTHLPKGSRSFYKTDPPTSGPHDLSWLPPSVYKAEETTPELLVHNLEHGNIVIYFDKTVLSPSEIKWLTETINPYIGQWDGVLMVGRKDKEHPLILTAWRATLRMKGLDQKKVLTFIDAFRGRGPENPVR